MLPTKPNSFVKTCSMCGDVWRLTGVFLSDPMVHFLGYQARLDETPGLFLFIHVRCGTTLAVYGSAFAELNMEIVLRDSCAVLGRQEDYCLAFRQNQACPPKCPCADVARISSAILNWPKDRLT